MASPVSTDGFGSAVEIRAEWGHSWGVAWSPRLGIGLSNANSAVCLQEAIFGISFFGGSLGRTCRPVVAPAANGNAGPGIPIVSPH
jgi:hypothetical protein